MNATDPSTTGYDARAVANWFLDRAEADGRELNQVQLHKLVYLAHGWHLGNTGQPLIRGEVQAWPLGPIIPEIYQEFKQYGDAPIQGRAFDYDFLLRRNVDFRAEFSSESLRILEKIWRAYGDLSGKDLSDWTAEKGSPWDQVVATPPEVGGSPKPIPNTAIKGFYDDQVRLIRSRS